MLPKDGVPPSLATIVLGVTVTAMVCSVIVSYYKSIDKMCSCENQMNKYVECTLSMYNLTLTYNDHY